MIEVFDEYFLPEKFRKLKEEHYRDIFREDYKEVYEESKSFNDNEKTLFMMVDDEFAARAVLEFNKYDVRMRDFTVLKEFRSNGIAKKFMKSIEDIVLDYHNKMLRSEVKAYDIMFLRTYFYPKRTLYDLTTLPYDEKFQMGHFLEKHDFKAYKYNPKVLSEEEKMALQVYSSNYPEFLPSLRVFKKEIANNLELMPEIKEELSKLDKKRKKIVLDGLDVKLDVYDQRGFVSYKYDVCPVCADMKSSLEDSSNCSDCYIENACLEPFREGFKDDNEISQVYFSKMRDFLKSERVKYDGKGGV